MKTNLMFAMLVLGVLGLVAQAEVIRSTAFGNGADTFVGNDSNKGPNNNYGGGGTMDIRIYPATRAHIGYVKFDISKVAGDMTGAQLQFYITQGGSARTWNVYGLTDNAVDDAWGEMSITYNTAPGMAAATLGNYTIDSAKLTLLGTMAVPSTAPFLFTSDAAALNLASFLKSDTNGLVTLVLIPTGSDRQYYVAAKEGLAANPTWSAPTLIMPNASLGGGFDPVPAEDAVVNRNLLTQLSWTLIPGIAKCDVYFGTDPNILNPAMKKLSFAPAVSSVNIADFPGFSVPLPDGKYYWRVDCYDKLTDPNVLTGPFWSFTATSTPVFNSITPVAQAKFEGQDADAITAEFESTTAMNFAWFRSVDNSPDTAADDASVGGNSKTLSLSGLTVADEAWYFCKATNAGGATASAPARVTIKRLLAHYALDGNAADSSPAKLDGTLMGEPAFGAGVNEKTGQALNFDGVDDFVDLPDDFSDFSAGLTIAVWANPAVVTTWARFVDLGNGPDSENIFLTRNASTNNLTLNVYKGTASAGNVTATNALDSNQWQMFVATMDDGGNVVLYKNGLPIQTGTLSQKPNIVPRTSNFIGDSNWTTDAFYNGSMDDLRIYNYAISADAVADLYSAVAGNFCRTPQTLDYNGNCKVDLPDFAIFAADWLKCGLYPECP